MKLCKMTDLLKKWGVDEDCFIPYGHEFGKIDPKKLEQKNINKKDGRYLIVSAITPTPLGEGKTVSSISLSLGFNRLGKECMVNLRQPSAGPLFGIKGGASGGGKALILPVGKINLNFTGDFHKISFAHNLIAALFENAVFHKKIDFHRGEYFWKRVMDLNDRFLRHIVIGLGGSTNGIAQESGFDITPVSEIMSILGLSTNMDDVEKKIDRIILGKQRNGGYLRFGQLGCTAAVLGAIDDSFYPNIVRTAEDTPAFVHTGPFANISYGNSSVIADKLALKMTDYVVTEAGFGADIGLEKFFHIKTRYGQLNPSGIVLVATIRGLKYQSGHFVAKGRNLPEGLFQEDLESLRDGLPHLKHHIKIAKSFKKPVFVLINRFEADTDAEVEMVQKFALDAGAAVCNVCDGFSHGGEGAVDICTEIDDYLNENPVLSDLEYHYDLSDSIEDKINKIAGVFYNASGVDFSAKAKKKLKEYADQGFDELPICIAKTSASISHNPALKGVPSNYTFEISDLRIAGGAGYIIPLAGNIMTMPGLPSVPNAVNFKKTDDGQIIW